jgi:hypothetical protein
MPQEKIDILENIIYDSLIKHPSVTDEEKKQIIKLIKFYYTSNIEVNELIKETWNKAETLARGLTTFRGKQKCFGQEKMFYAKKNFLTEKLK